jgi:hypothetical protein
MTACGYGVPLYRYEGERPQIEEWADHEGSHGIARYRAKKNARSVDGPAGLRRS